jgi:hypothetical protein
MKYLITVIILLGLGSLLSGQKVKNITGLYGECPDGYFACEQIELKNDSTFEYAIFYDVGGWIYWSGTYKIDRNFIIINSYAQPLTEAEKQMAKEAYNFYTSGFITDLKFQIKGSRLYTYDFEKNHISKKRFLKKTSAINKKFRIPRPAS